MEHWVQDVLDGLGKESKLVAVEASQGIELRKLDHEDARSRPRVIEKEHEHEHHHGDTDPHVWLSPVLRHR